MCLYRAKCCFTKYDDKETKKIYRRYFPVPFCILFTLNLHIHPATFYITIADVIMYSTVLYKRCQKYNGQLNWFIQFATTVALIIASIQVIIGNRLRQRRFYLFYLLVQKALIYSAFFNIFISYTSAVIHIYTAKNMVDKFFKVYFTILEIFIVLCVFVYNKSRRGTIQKDYEYLCNKKEAIVTKL
ncbi:unnamed protein product [Bursaphelenchus okinawaensis]|uniref:Uncharacterized protein n=1 Tax=Bursaphelenchus okinawaensis TaxID=465554 RepID=A0A811LJU7_9BILA|nr:unnamed protein product [Bursaphelenchus okinawaensis]CAG9123793.1 unnamed protein product [Bursaphelenchus okinawaensis]